MNNATGRLEYLWSETTNKLRESAEMPKIPLMGTFELTARCNLECKMCYIRQDGGEIVLKKEKTASEWIEMGRQAASAGTLFLLITGGEPFLRRDFQEIYLGLNRLGMVVTLLTNATLIDESVIRWLAKTPPSKIGVSLYGAASDTYERVTGNKAGFRLAMRGIDLLLNAGIKVELRTTITHGNKKDLEKMALLAKERGLNLEPTFIIRKPVRGASTSSVRERLSPEEMFELCEEFFGTQTHKTTLKPGQSKPESMFCAAGKCAYWISWEGKMLPCGLMYEPSVDPFDLGFVKAWDELKGSTNTIPSPSECSECECRPFCEVCPGKLQAETGSFSKTSFYICQNAKLAKERIDRDYEKGIFKTLNTNG